MMKHSLMVRAISLVAMGGGFLMISPKLRDGVGGVLTVITSGLNDYSPFSYIVLGIGILALMTVSMHNAATKR